ncbi:phenylalanine--tRNA ligase subunit beta [Candidatus Saccharibacteria bacterium TM7i]|nr:phenylalanine--tRNA ligase subunit beta [Candidatus Saccharibacteria bacterium TM7i]
MIISVNWLKQFVDIDMPIDELVTLIGERLVEVEGTEDLAEKYKDVVVAKIISAERVEGSDHLSLLWIDDSGVVQDVDRNEEGYVQVVCGAPNVRKDLLVAWLPPKCVVPETFGSDEPFVLSARPLMGHVSNGMIASARELDLYDEHDGILEIDKDAAAGSSFAELYDLNDTLIDIENKSLTHRPDAFGVIGFAREVAGIQGKRFETPEWLKDTGTTLGAHVEGFTAPRIYIEDAGLSKRFQMIVLDGVREDMASSVQMQTYLARSGVRPVNAMVDISNYLMLLTGQPTHMYDYDKLKAVAGDTFTVGVRLARQDETLTLLDGKEITMDASDIVITAGDTAIGLAGIMGGQSTATDATTKTVALEVATFDLYHMRSSQMRHGIFSEAVTRYTKGVPAELGRPVLNKTVGMVEEHFGARVVSETVDEYVGETTIEEIGIDSERVNALLGTQFSAEDIASLLDNVEFSVSFNADRKGRVTVPYWRNDIHIPEDIIEEVGRLSGFDSINATMPSRDFTAVHPTRFDDVRNILRQALVKSGLNEVLTYSFVHGDLLKRAGQRLENSYRITNSISPDLQYYRQSLTPSLLQHINPNIRLGYGQFGIFEFNKVHEKSSGLTDESVPLEKNSVALILADAKNTSRTAYYQAKYVLEYMLKAIGVTVQFLPLEGDIDEARASVFEPKRSARVATRDGVTIGVIGEYKASMSKTFKLPAFAAGFELSVDELVECAAAVPVHYSSVSRYPGMERDVCFKVPQEASYAQIIEAAESVLGDIALETSIAPLDIYQPEDGETKNITVRINAVSHEKTMTTEEMTAVVDAVISKVTEVTHGEVV